MRVASGSSTPRINNHMTEISIALAWIVFGYVAVSLILTALHYPRNTDAAERACDGNTPREFYEGAYSESSSQTPVATDDDEYGHSARDHARKAGIPGILKAFLREYNLTSASALEVGCGSGLLQDVTDHYVGMDLSFSASRFFHKPFVQGSATQMPFSDSTFDVAWSIWVVEHVPTPEQALSEIRRVVKDKGYILLRPAWNVDSWASEGYEVRPYSDFGFWGKLIKASIPIRSSKWYAVFHARQIRLLRTLLTKLSGKPSRLHYSRLNANYSTFWVTDSDAAVSLDFFEVYLWFHSRGDECVNCPSLKEMLIGRPGGRSENLIIRVNKSHES
jgi:SAM-dependent methyltransferase